MSKLVIRWDIDTHKCIRDGVPLLLDVAENYQVPFTFFLNTGQAVAFKDSLKSMLKIENSQSEAEEVLMMSARSKFGNKDYLEAALRNPSLMEYKDNIIRLYNSSCELGLHGGRNHALWQKYASTWTKDQVADELYWALEEIRHVIPEYKAAGFLSPGWNTPEGLDEALKWIGFTYCADYRRMGESELIDNTRAVPFVGTNLLYEPGAVAFLEGSRVRGMSDDDILQAVRDSLMNREITVMYDHPYYGACTEIELVKKIVEMALDMGVEMTTLASLLEGGVSEADGGRI
ncbi:MAG: polysaccharide deacetylase family protein [Pseudobutyrivibrio sp.]|nr:polysaccharide deacetylase family protein [Pseudobutyrivibrio sp.]